jgi:hypothetical protein
MADRDQLVRQTRSRIQRIQELRQRTLAIEQRNLELARHESARCSSVGDVRRAEERADRARAHVAMARERALQALLRSAAAHGAAAERYEQLAAAGYGDAGSHLTRAAGQREMAAADRRVADEV